MQSSFDYTGDVQQPTWYTCLFYFSAKFFYSFFFEFFFWFFFCIKEKLQFYLLYFTYSQVKLLKRSRISNTFYFNFSHRACMVGAKNTMLLPIRPTIWTQSRFTIHEASVICIQECEWIRPIGRIGHGSTAGAWMSLVRYPRIILVVNGDWCIP